ncbi:A24 family peptidase [Anaeromyxobacter sp. SG17]|uniref:prepilin peptidase n=1 Tax=Anaeromyxobacter sp. SG17 TaxID=2925405 RepID=UPI001F5A56E8|nr:A24 family peptidase [Anaeromyxobacter sp. SG17]
MSPLDAPLARAVLGAWAALVGAVLGSFLNVVIARVPAGLSVVRPRSRCPRCLSEIAWYDNVPVISWVLLRGRCRRCGLPISIRYPLVELLGAVVGWLAWNRHGLSPEAGAEIALVLTLVALAFIDLDTWLLPHVITWPLLGGGVLASALGWSAAPSLASSLWGAGVGWGAFALLSWGGEKILRKEALGFGDVWLLGGLGAWLGLGALLPLVLLASVQGSVVGIVLVLLGKSQTGERGANEARPAGDEGAADEDWVPPKNAVPFGPFLALGAIEWLYGAELLARAFPALGAFR